MQMPCAMYPCSTCVRICFHSNRGTPSSISLNDALLCDFFSHFPVWMSSNLAGEVLMICLVWDSCYFMETIKLNGSYPKYTNHHFFLVLMNHLNLFSLTQTILAHRIVSHLAGKAKWREKVQNICCFQF